MQLRHLRRTWEHLGRRDPLWAILTWSDKQGRKWEVDEFFATGRAEVERLMAYLDRVRPGLARQRALDFGCGIGRVTQALAATFDRATGVDVAAPMIALAGRYNTAPDRCQFVTNRAPHLRCFASDSFELVYSRMVLQHMPPRLVRGYLPELLRVLAPGGALVFQLPGRIDVDAQELFQNAPIEGGWLKRHLPLGLVRVWRALKYRVVVGRTSRQMEMYGMDRDDVVALLDSSGARILDIHDDHAHGTDAPGFEYCVTKERAAGT